jgi:hypothetical protein
MQRLWSIEVHGYRDIHTGQIVLSDQPRDDLLEWAYWRELSPAEVAELDKADEPAKKAPAKKAAPRASAKAEGGE